MTPPSPLGCRHGGPRPGRRVPVPGALCQSQRDALVREHLSLADRLAGSLCRRYADLVELEDLRQEARLELVRAAARCQGSQPEPYLRRCISGALLHHLRDRVLLVRLPPRRRDAGPGRHVSLDVPAPGAQESQAEQLVAPAEPAVLTEPDSSDGLTPELEALLAALPERQATAVRLTVLEGLSLRLAGEQLGVSPTTVQRAQRLGLEALRLELSPHRASVPDRSSLP
jgi:RNA polymerase sigma-B factor